MAVPLSDITSIIREVLANSTLELAADTRFEDLTGWDSMDLISMVVEVECRLNLQFEPGEIEQLTTVGDLLRVIEAKRALASA